MSVLDTDLLAEIQAALVDDASWSTAQWTQQEAVDALNQAQDRFLRETGVVLAVTTLPAVPNVVTQALPPDWQQTQRVAWKDQATGIITPLGQADPWEADQTTSTWPYDQATTHPVLYSDINVAPSEYNLLPAPRNTGAASMHYVAQGTTLTGTGTALSVPDDCAPAVRWLALATLLRKLNRSIDADRAGYCEQRYRDLVEAVNVGLLGF